MLAQRERLHQRELVARSRPTQGIIDQHGFANSTNGSWWSFHVQARNRRSTCICEFHQRELVVLSPPSQESSFNAFVNSTNGSWWSFHVQARNHRSTCICEFHQRELVVLSRPS